MNRTGGVRRSGLRALGCDLGQGFLYARPLEPAALTAFLRAHPGPCPAAARAPRPNNTSGLPRRRARTVLVVDDDAAIRRTVRRMLEPRGFAVLEAHDGADALRRLAAHDERVDLVLTDVAMPELSGGRLADALRSAHSPDRRTPPRGCRAACSR